MSVEWIQPEDQRWGNLVARVRHDFYHLPAYARLVGVTEKGRAGALYATHDGDALLWPLLERDIPESNLKDLVSPYGYPCPITTASSPERADALFARTLPDAMALWRSRGIVSLFSRLHPLLDTPQGPLQQLGVLVKHGDTVSIDTTLDDEAGFAQFRTMNRRHVRAAKRSGFVARHDPKLEQLDVFVRLYNDTMRRIGATSYYLFPDEYYDGLRAALGDGMSIWFAERDGEIGAAVLFCEVSGIVEYHLSANDDRFASCHPTKLVIDAARIWAHQRGNSCLHLGGGYGGTDDNLFFFKAGFSRRRHPFWTFRAVMDETAYQTLMSQRAPGEDPTARSGFFPGYRKVTGATSPGK